MSVWKGDCQVGYFKGFPSNTDGSGGGSRLKQACSAKVLVNFKIFCVAKFLVSPTVKL